MTAGSTQAPADPDHETALTGITWVRGLGSFLTDSRGREHVDLGGGTLSQPIGHCHPAVVEAVRAQAGTLENVHDCAHPTRTRAESLLRRLLPERLSRVRFFNTGSEAVEAALRLVNAVAPRGRRRIAAIRRGFHGKTRGSRALVQWDVGAEAASAATLGYPAYCYRCPFQLTYPRCDLLCARLTVAQVVSRNDVAALVAEPVPGSAGVLVPPPGYWDIVAKGCRDNDVLLVADEVMTGGGRLGRFLGSHQLGFEPDIVALAKGIGSGYPVSAVAAPDEIGTAQAWTTAGGTSTTFGGSAVPLAAAAATMSVLAEPATIGNAARLAEVFGSGLDEIAKATTVGQVRHVGLLGAIEFVTDRDSKQPAPEIADRVVVAASRRGVRLLPGGHILRLAPALTTEPQVLASALRTVADIVQEGCRD